MDEYLNEEWRPVVGFPNYFVSTHGRVWSGISQIILRQCATKHGHKYVDLYRCGEKHRRYIHRLMAIAFIPNPENFPVVRHKDDDPEYNHVSNIEWGTQRDNIDDAIQNGNRPGRALQRLEVIETGELYDSIHACARAIGGSAPGIAHVLSGKTKHHKHLTFRRIEV